MPDRGPTLLPLARKALAVGAAVGGDAAVEQEEHFEQGDPRVRREACEGARGEDAVVAGRFEARLAHALELGVLAADEDRAADEDHAGADGAAEGAVAHAP